jgi:hypothetical protein
MKIIIHFEDVGIVFENNHRGWENKIVSLYRELGREIIFTIPNSKLKTKYEKFKRRLKLK